MKRVQGSRGMQQIECINKYTNKWAVRMDIQPYTDTSIERESNPDAVDYYEKTFMHRPYIEDIKEFAIECISDYDKSDNVDSFTVQGHKMWIDRDLRVSLSRDCVIAKEGGLQNVTFWNGIVPITLNTDDAILYLKQLEQYAWNTFNVTSQHKMNIVNLQTEDEVLGYNFRTGYPDKLNFK